MVLAGANLGFAKCLGTAGPGLFQQVGMDMGYELGQITGPRPWPVVVNDMDVTRWPSPKKTLELW